MINNISYLKSIKPRYSILLYSLLLSIIVLVITMFIFKVYDVYITKGYLECGDNCKISISMDYLNVDKVSKVDMIKINKENIYPKNIIISDVLVDENTKNNYQIVSFEVDQLDNGKSNIFYDVKLYSNYELIIDKIIKFLF